MAAVDDVANEHSVPFRVFGPARNAEVVTPSNTVTLAKVSRALYVGVTGDVSVQMAGTGTAVVFTAVPAGAVLPIRITRVNSSATTATNMVSLY